MSAEQLDLDDLDAEDLKALAEVSKKGYYHARPKSEAAPVPQRLEVDPSTTAVSSTGKREDFDAFQKKWDRFDNIEADTQDGSRSTTAPSRINSQPTSVPAPVQRAPVQADEAVVAQLISMGFDEPQSREAAIATGNRPDAAVEYILGGGSRQGSRTGTDLGSSPAAQPVQQTSQPIEVDEEKLSLLLEMGFPEVASRSALESCKNDLERAIEHAANRAEENLSRLRRAREVLTELDADVAALEATEDAVPDLKRLRYLEENLTQASCALDSVEVGNEESRAERRVELDHCNVLDSRLARLRGRAAGDASTSGCQASVAAADASLGSPDARDEAMSVQNSAGATGDPTSPDAAPGAQSQNESVTEDTGASGAAAASERIAEAERLRLVGNTAFKAEDFKEAVKNYLGALALDEENVAILSNLAAAELKLGDFEAAAAHAGAANTLSGGFSAKALFRQGQALEGLGRYAEACEAFRAAIQVEPNDRVMRQRLQDCRKKEDESRKSAAAAAHQLVESESCGAVAEPKAEVESSASPQVAANSQSGDAAEQSWPAQDGTSPE